MILTVYHLKTCDTCRKAIKALQSADHDLTLVDIRADGLKPETVKSLLQAHGWEVMLNRRSTTWRGLDADDKVEMTNDKAFRLLTQHPTLMKRPVVMSEDQTTIGWANDAQAIWI